MWSRPCCKATCLDTLAHGFATFWFTCRQSSIIIHECFHKYFYNLSGCLCEVWISLFAFNISFIWWQRPKLRTSRFPQQSEIGLTWWQASSSTQACHLVPSAPTRLGDVYGLYLFPIQIYWCVVVQDEGESQTLSAAKLYHLLSAAALPSQAETEPPSVVSGVILIFIYSYVLAMSSQFLSPILAWTRK